MTDNKTVEIIRTVTEPFELKLPVPFNVEPMATVVMPGDHVVDLYGARVATDEINDGGNHVYVNGWQAIVRYTGTDPKLNLVPNFGPKNWATPLTVKKGLETMVQEFARLMRERSARSL